MKKMISVILALALALCFAVPAASADEAAFLGEPFPDFTAEDTEGNTFTLSEALKSHDAVLINFWATWCPPCENEFPFLQALWEKYGGRVAFIALSVDDGDTVEKIASYRESRGLTFPMGRDEGGEVYSFLNIGSIPDTVIVDRFGSAVFFHNGMFFSAAEAERCLAAFLGEGYTQSTVLTEIPQDTSTRAYPVSAKRAVYVENENAKPVYFWFNGNEDPLVCYIVPDGTAHLRLELAAADDPGRIVYNDLWGALRYAEDLLDPDRGAYIHDQVLEGIYDGVTCHFNYGYLVNMDLGGLDPDIVEYYVIADEAYIGEVEADLRSMGAEDIRWEIGEPVQAGNGPQAYILHVVDQENAPVPEVFVNFCTDVSCVPLESDENGLIVFSGAPDVYHVQVVDIPDGYSCDDDFEMYTGRNYGEWMLRIRKD